jgi:hypothetical protein
MLYKKIIAVCSEIQTQLMNSLFGQNLELLNVKGNRWALKCRTWHDILLL